MRQKYFCIRPQPLERWLWSQRIPSSAERVFWLHWQEGMRRGDWCSEIPLRRVAGECHLDTSTVTRAYQLLIRLGCLRRTDPGRDPANPFQQATAVTEIRLPRELLQDLNRYPNRRSKIGASDASAEEGRAREISSHPIPAPSAAISPSAAVASRHPPSADSPPPPAFEPPRQIQEAAHSGESATMTVDSTTNRSGESEPMDQHSSADNFEPAAPNARAASRPSDPFPELTGRTRLRAITQLLDLMSPQERRVYQDALRLHQATMQFDAHSRLSPETQAKILLLLASLATTHPPTPSSPALRTTPRPNPHPHKPTPTRKLSLFELGRLRHHLQTATSITAAPDLLRQVVWSVEAGSLRRFDTRHAIHIALKKIREGLWTRPNRMPPNWARSLSEPPATETCAAA